MHVLYRYSLALKKDLWDVIKKSKTPPVYVIDKIAEEKGGS